MKKELPFGIKVVVFFIITLIQVAVFNLFHVFNGNGLYFTIEGFNLIFWIITAIAMLNGIVFVNLFRAWSVNDLIKRMENPVFINHVILSLHARKLQLQDELSWKLPDPIQVHIVEGEDKSKTTEEDKQVLKELKKISNCVGKRGGTGENAIRHM